MNTTFIETEYYFNDEIYIIKEISYEVTWKH